MLMLLAIIEFLRAIILRLLYGRAARSSHLHHFCGPRRSHKHHRHCHSKLKPEWLKQEILRLKARIPQAGCRTIADICNRHYAVSHRVGVGKTYVHYMLQRHGYEIQVLRRKLKHAKPKTVPRNLIWGIDLTGKTDAHGKLPPLLGVIDHGSRVLLHLQDLHDKTSRTLIASIVQVIRTCGKPRIIRTDNEAIFTSKQFRLGLEKLGIRHQRTTPGCPWQNGRIERLFGTLKQKLDQRIYIPLPLAGEGWRVREQLNADLAIFRHWYNHVRPHQNLNGQTPAEAWNGISPYTKPPKQKTLV